MNDSIYIAKSINGDSSAQKWLFERYAGSMLKLCKRYLKDDFEANEAFIQAFRKAFEKLDTFKERDSKSFKNWLSRIMINECLMILRKSHRFERVEDSSLEIASEQVSSHDSEYIYQLILNLPLGYRTVFNLHTIEGYDHKEIAELLQINEGTSRSQLSKARQILQQKINEINNANGTF